MSASDTEIETQADNHRPSLLGIGVAVVAVAFVLISISVYGADPAVNEASSGDTTPATAPAVAD